MEISLMPGRHPCMTVRHSMDFLIEINGVIMQEEYLRGLVL